MAVPLPTDPDLTPPSLDETRATMAGVLGAVRGDDGLAPLDGLLIGSVARAMTGHEIDVASLEPASPAELGATLARRTLAFRERIVQTMLLGELVLVPLPQEVCHRVRVYADELGVADDMIDVAEDFATGALDLAATDFARNGYLSSVDPDRLSAVHADALRQSWDEVEDDPVLAARWASLEDLPVGTLGRGVADFYRDRGFAYPGLPGSAPPLLAQHDWVHVLAGYGTTLENELEVFGYIARANDDPRAFSLLASVVSLFQSGYLASAAGGFFTANAGHLDGAGMTDRLADAMRRGALTSGSHDFLDTDWFALADRPVHELRRELAVPAKAVATPGPWDDGGITAYQLTAARQARPDRPAWSPDPTRG